MAPLFRQSDYSGGIRSAVEGLDAIIRERSTQKVQQSKNATERKRELAGSAEQAAQGVSPCSAAQSSSETIPSYNKRVKDCTRAEIVQALGKSISVLRQMEQFPPGSPCQAWAFSTRRVINNVAQGVDQIDKQIEHNRPYPEAAAAMASGYPGRYAMFYQDLGRFTPDPKRVSNGCK